MPPAASADLRSGSDNVSSRSAIKYPIRLAANAIDAYASSTTTHGIANGIPVESSSA